MSRDAAGAALKTQDPPAPVLTPGRGRLGELLVHRGIITPAQLDEALAEQTTTAKFLGTILVAKGWASEEEVARALSEQLGLAYVDLVSHPVEPGVLDLVPEALCRSHQAVPLFTMGDTLTVAMANPLDTAATAALQQASQRHIRPVFAAPSAIRRVLDAGYSAATAPRPESGWAGAGVVGLPVQEKAEAGGAEPVAQLKAVASLAPVVHLVDGMIRDAVTAGASDIHLEPSEGQLACRFRIDGVLHPRSPISKEYQSAIVSRIKIMANMDIAEKRLPQDGRIQTTADERTVDLRISTFPTVHGEKVVLRILDKQRALVTLEHLGFSERIFAQFTDLIARPHGIVLVTGPTGAGKTTTLYAALNRLDRTEKNIMTLEDPVEYELPGISQSQVNPKAGLTFATGLRSMVRQDPDIIFIGEIRDKETAEIAIHASLTGHLVFSTIHTNDAASATTRLIDMGVEPFLVATSLIGVLAQRLVRTLCTACKAPYQPSRELLAQLGLPGTGLPGLAADSKGTLFKEVGCPACRQTGYQGRIGLFELLVPTERIRELITQKVPAGVVREEAVRGGLVTLQQDGIAKVARGMTSVAEILRVTGEE